MGARRSATAPRAAGPAVASDRPWTAAGALLLSSSAGARGRGQGRPLRLATRPVHHHRPVLSLPPPSTGLRGCRCGGSETIGQSAAAGARQAWTIDPRAVIRDVQKGGGARPSLSPVQHFYPSRTREAPRSRSLCVREASRRYMYTARGAPFDCRPSRYGAGKKAVLPPRRGAPVSLPRRPGAP